MTNLNNVKDIINGSLELNIQQTKEVHVSEGSTHMSKEEATARSSFTSVSVTERYVATAGEYVDTQSEINAQYDQSATDMASLKIL